ATLAIVTGAALSLILFAVLRERETEIRRESLRKLARDRAEVLHTQMLRSMEVLHGIAALFETRSNVSRTEFHAFVGGALTRQPELQALAWDPRVPQAARPFFESSA